MFIEHLVLQLTSILKQNSNLKEKKKPLQSTSNVIILRDSTCNNHHHWYPHPPCHLNCRSKQLLLARISNISNNLHWSDFTAFEAVISSFLEQVKHEYKSGLVLIIKSSLLWKCRIYRSCTALPITIGFIRHNRYLLSQTCFINDL